MATRRGASGARIVAAVLALVCGWVSTACAADGPPVEEPARPTATQGVLASATRPATASPTSTPTMPATVPPTPSVTPTAHPLSIAALRAADLGAPRILAEQELTAGDGYRRLLITYPSDGLRVNALLTIPTRDPPASGWPAIVFNHGYIPPAQYRTGQRYVAYVDAFARNGYVVIMPDYRGHASSGGDAPGGYGSQAYSIDVLSALEAVRAREDVDGSRVGMWGHSMGGWITLRSMVVSDAIRAGVIWGGVVVGYPDLFDRWRRPTNFTHRIPRSRTRWRGELFEAHGAPQENPEFWSALSANDFLADLSGPIQLHHGTEDSSVPLEFSEILRDEIEAVGGEVELITYPGDDHNLSGNLGRALATSLAFFDRHVKGQPPAGVGADP